MADYSFHTYAPDVLVYDPNTGQFNFSGSYDFRTDRNQIDYSDDDTQFDGDQNNDGVGDDANQVGTAYDDTGAPIASGTVYVQQYATIQAPDGTQFTIDRIEIDGVHVGYLPSAPLTPGTSYATVNSDNVGTSAGSSGSDNTLSHSYYETNSVACYRAGTLIETAAGPVPVEQLTSGDCVASHDHGMQPVRWVHRHTQSLDACAHDARPVLIKSNALGPGRPVRDTVVSPQHRILVGERDQGAAFLTSPALVPAKALTHRPGIRHMAGLRDVSWVHFACDAHELIRANGLVSETMLIGDACLRMMSPTDRMALFAIFGHAENGADGLVGPPARTCLSVAQARSRTRRMLACT